MNSSVAPVESVANAEVSVQRSDLVRQETGGSNSVGNADLDAWNNPSSSRADDR